MANAALVNGNERRLLNIVEAPEHYIHLTPEPLSVLESWNLPYNLSAAIKYMARAGHKDNHVQDLQKAAEHLRREIARLNKDGSATF